MLEISKKNLQKCSSFVRDRVHVYHQSMTAFNFDRKFNTIICCDAFFHNLTVENEILCLQKVAAHLTAKGVFVFNLPNPSCDYILRASENDGRFFEERGRYDLGDNNGYLVVEQAQIGNSELQRITTKLRFKRYDQNGIVVEQGESSWASRYLFKHKAIHLLHRCGFKILNLVGDYKGGPVEKGSQLIFEAGLKS